MIPAWTFDARCATVGPAVMFPEGVGYVALTQTREAKAVCAHCRVRPECLAYALEREGDSTPAYRAGVWGGLDRHQRYRIGRERRQQTAGAA
jgi:WhiB family redox-sensing transcriptional regulator